MHLYYLSLKQDDQLVWRRTPNLMKYGGISFEIRSCHSADGKFPRRDLLYDGEFNLFHHKCSSEELPRRNEMHNRHSESSLGLKKKETYLI